MQPLIIYFNELSSPICSTNPVDADPWRELTCGMFLGLLALSRVRNNFSLIVPKGHWHALYLNKPLCNWLEGWLGKDRYRWLRAKVRQDVTIPDLCEVHCAGNVSAGITLAHLGDSWTVSIPIPQSEWSEAEITGVKYEINDNAKSSEDTCVVKNLASELHAAHWQGALLDWGRRIAETNEIANVAGHAIDMYPLDHGYPHVHLVSPYPPRPTIAKYRIDVFGRLEGPPQFDREMKEWIAQNQILLLASWGRCQRGQHPFKIA